MLYTSYRHYIDEYTPSPPAQSFRDVLAAIEVDNLELPDGAPDSSYMFHNPEEVDMDAYCSRYISRHEFGGAPDAATYFDKLSERFGFKCREELRASIASPVAPSVSSREDGKQEV